MFFFHQKLPANECTLPFECNTLVVIVERVFGASQP